LVTAIRYRGPDYEESWQAEITPSRRLCLLHTRLAILDLSSAGRQPMIDPETGIVIVFNGEIYNFVELRSELQKLDPCYQSRSSTDTEVLLRGYAAWGTEMLKRLDEMFAFVLYDSHRRTLLVARDHIGIKPLYFVEMRVGGLAFAEAMAAGLPCVCGSTDASSEVAENGVTGFCVNPRKPKEVAAALLQILTDQLRRDRMSAAARSRFERLYTKAAFQMRLQGCLARVQPGAYVERRRLMI